MSSVHSKVLQQFNSYGIHPHNPNNGIGMWPEEQELFLKLYSESCPPEDHCKLYLEIGTHNGGSVILAETYDCLMRNKLDMYACFDPEESPWWKINKYRANSTAQLFLDKSDNIHKRFNKDGNFIFDFAFIDGFHSYKQVLIDFEQVFPIMKKGGIVAFHDASPRIQKEEKRKEILQFAKDNEQDLLNTNYEDFYVDEAYCQILEKYLVEHIDCEIECFHPRETRLNSWIRGKTSPHSALAAVRIL